MPLKVLLLEGIHEKAAAQFRSYGYTVKTFAKALPEEQLIAELTGENSEDGGVHIVGIRSKTKLTEKVLKAAQGSLLAVGCFCIGTNQVDLVTANDLGIPVFNAPFANTRSVAELVIGEVIAMSRKLFDTSAAMHRGDWQKTATGCNEIRGKTLGVVGYGHIGTQLGVLCEMLGMSVIFYDVVPKLSLGNNKQMNSMDDVFRNADFVTLHVPETAETKNMIGAEHFKLMKKTACFLNLSRGTVVDLDALADALREKRIAGAAVDVYPVEPEANGPGFVSPLQNLANVILTPHVGGSTMEAQAAIGAEVGGTLHKLIVNGSTTGAVNFPEISPPEKSVTNRLICIHRNTPGVLVEINKIVVELKANLRSQQLATDDNIGVVSLDVSLDVVATLQDRIAASDWHIKSYVCRPNLNTPHISMAETINVSPSIEDMAILPPSVGGSVSRNSPSQPGASNVVSP